MKDQPEFRNVILTLRSKT